MDGLNFKCSSTILSDYFTTDNYGSYVPDRNKLHMDAVVRRFQRQLNADSGLFRRLAEIYERTDVMFTDNPHGNTPTIGVGFKMFGKRPLDAKMREKIKHLEGKGQNVDRQLDHRENKIESTQLELMKLHADLKPTLKGEDEQLLWLVEGDQVMTGGGFDGNHIGEVHKAALHFITDSTADIGYANSELSQLVVNACLEVKDELIKGGLIVGSLGPMGASVVRAEQDSDGMFGWPVYVKGHDELNQDVALRLLIESGVDTRKLVGSPVQDQTTKINSAFRIIDAGGYILDNKIFTADDMVSLVTLLARIQKHGYTEKNGRLIAKDGKTRAVYPNSFLAAIIEAMIITSFNDKLKELKMDFMPSLQDKPTRVQMVKRQILDALQKGYDYLPADWSKWDASIKGAILATIIQLVVKPFYRSEYYYWVDAATFILTYKWLILSTDLARINATEFDEAKKNCLSTEIKGYTLCGLCDGLISGAKFTHVGGSLYGEVVIHHAIPRMLGYVPIMGAQAGDDTLMGVPISMIDASSAKNTYTPIFEAATKFGLHANASKQMWHQCRGEVVKVFLQDSYNSNANVWGVGSIFRPVDAVWFSERNKGLSIAEQLMAEIARMNQGADSPFASTVVEWWLSKEKYLGWMFNRYGTNAFQKLVETIGRSPTEIAQTIDVGSFSFGVSKTDLEAGTLPILNVMADVSSHMSFSSGDEASFLRDLNQEDKGTASDETLQLEAIDDSD